MAVPGFSVNDLIQALGQAIQVYDAFFSKYKNTATQVRQLAEDIESFRCNLQNHKDTVERHGLEYSGYKAFSRTLEECYDFLSKYQSALDNRFSASGVFRTTRFAFVQDDVARLRNQIARHGDNILLHSMNIVLENSLRSGSVAAGPVQVSQPLSIPSPNLPSTSVTPPLTPPNFFQSPTLAQDGFSNGNLSASPRAISIAGNLSPELRATRASTHGSPGSPSMLSPETERDSRRQETTLDSLVLPQPALPYCVAKIYFGSKSIELKRKPVGRDFVGGREFVIVDEFGKPRFAHRIKLPPNQVCFPFTWHRRWKDHDPLEVTFKGPAPDHHSIVFKGQLAGSGTPRYIFSTYQDFVDFQSQVRGKELICSMDFRQIRAGNSTKHGEATDQHLKIWKDRISHEHSISFYASAVDKPRHLEFPILMFNQDLKASGGADVGLEFASAAESKHRFSKAFSRSPTEKSSSSTSGPSIFSRTQTGFTATTAATTVADSRMSIASFGSNSSGEERRKNSLSPIESQARSLKYLNVEFSDESEAAKFRVEFRNVYKEEISRPSEFFLDWQLGTTQRTGSVISGYTEIGTSTKQFAELDSKGNMLHEMGGSGRAAHDASMSTRPATSPLFEMDGMNLAEME